jgi:membrane protease subunit HflK
MGVLYLVSGISIIRPNEIAVVLRWGRLVGDARAAQEHGPGLLFTFPRPIDEVVRVEVKHVGEVAVKTLAFAPGDPTAYETPPDEEDTPGVVRQTLNPLTQGYALTGDHNVVHVEMVARYRIREPAEWAFYGAKSEDALRVEVTAAMVRSLGEMGVDRVLSDGRKALIVTATRRAQAGLDAAHSGLELTSLELTRLAPPSALSGDFAAVQSAFINAETRKQEAKAFAEGLLPVVTGQAEAAVQAARAAAASAIATANGDTSAFRALDREYRANPGVVRERLYRDGIEKAIGSATVRWVPPPIGGNYNGFRIAIDPVRAGPSSRPPE